MMLGDKISGEGMIMLRNRLDNINSENIDRLSQMLPLLNLKSPMIGLLLGLFFGCFGIDRFYKGNVVLGIFKLVTLGGFGIWALIDLFFVYQGIKKDNLHKIMMQI